MPKQNTVIFLFVFITFVLVSSTDTTVAATLPSFIQFLLSGQPKQSTTTVKTKPKDKQKQETWEKKGNMVSAFGVFYS